MVPYRPTQSKRRWKQLVEYPSSPDFEVGNIDLVDDSDVPSLDATALGSESLAPTKGVEPTTSTAIPPVPSSVSAPPVAQTVWPRRAVRQPSNDPVLKANKARALKKASFARPVPAVPNSDGMVDLDTDSGLDNPPLAAKRKPSENLTKRHEKKAKHTSKL